jgi:hypothetical protein
LTQPRVAPQIRACPRERLPSFGAISITYWPGESDAALRELAGIRVHRAGNLPPRSLSLCNLSR